VSGREAVLHGRFREAVSLGFVDELCVSLLREPEG
jgi:hypothetical protein